MFNLNKQINYQLTVILISLSESIENIILVWLIYNYTNSSFAIGLITFANYFPMFISAAILIFIADSINPIYQYYLNNILFIIISLCIFILFFLNINANSFLILIFILQMIYSITRTINKINSNKIIKLLFDEKKGNKIIQISFSITQIFQTLGNLFGNLFILNNISLYGFLLISFLYLLNLFFSFTLLKNNNKYFLLKEKEKRKKNTHLNLNWFKNILKNKKLVESIFFSIPSSGLYQYLITILPFITRIIHYKSNFIFSVLNFFCSLFSSIIGFLLYKNTISKKFIEKYTFILCFFLLTLMSFTKNFLFILILNSLCFGFLAGHIICMQIKINTNSSYFNLGKFIILRNSITSLSKIIFSFISVYILNNFSIFYIYIFIAITSLLFQIIYTIFSLQKKNLFNK